VITRGGAVTESFLERLKARDRLEQRRLRLVAIIMTCVGVALMGGAVARRASGTEMIAAVYLLLSGVAWLKSRWFAKVRYAEPTRDFLDHARNRYRFWRPIETVYAVPFGLLLAFGGKAEVMKMAVRYFSADGQMIALVVYVIFFVSAVGLGFLFTWKDWKKSTGLMFAEIQQLRKELGNG